MNYTVKKLSKISGISVRTLHYYDEIGLLKPAYVGESGYRYYQEEQLLLLQQILFFRELGFTLKQIHDITRQVDLDRVEALKSQKDLLVHKIIRLQTLINTIDTTLTYIEGKQTVKNSELFKGFEPDSEQQKKYKQYIKDYMIKKYGHQAQKEAEKGYKNTKKWSQDDWQKVRQEGDDMCQALVLMIEKKRTPDSQEVQEIVHSHYQWIKKFWTPTKESYSEHADFIIKTELRKFYDNYHPQLAQFIANAIKIFAEKSL